MTRTLSLEQAAEMLFCSPETVSEAIHARGLRAVKVGRAWVLIDDDVIAWLRSQYDARDNGGSAIGERAQTNALRTALAPTRANRRRRPGT